MTFQLVKMLSETNLASLKDDGFQASHNNFHIFTEAFLGNDTGDTRCLVTGAINFESDSSKNTDTSLCSNSDTSAITSPSSSKTLCLEDSHIGNENSGEPFASGCLSRFASVDIHDQVEGGKRMKFSVDELCDAKCESGGVSNPQSQSEGRLIGAPSPAMDSVCQTVTLHLVEAANQGVTSSCYLLKQRANMDREVAVDSLDVKECRLQNTDEDDKKKLVAVEAIASPISQESSATKLVVASPSINVAEKSYSPQNFENCSIGFNTEGLEISNLLPKTDPKEDPRPLLYMHVVQLLTGAGWRVEKRKRPCRKYVEKVYRSSGGNLYREFPKAWRAFINHLDANRYILVQEADGKQWTDIHHFWNDLSGALLDIEKEVNNADLSNSLALRWSLLDPFVNAVFIDRKVGFLRKGYGVKVGRSLVIDKLEEGNTKCPLKLVDSAENQFAQRPLLPQLCDSSIAAKSGLTVSEGSQCAYDEQSGTGSFFKHGESSKNMAANCLTGACTRTVDEEATYVVDTAVGIETCLVDAAAGTKTCLVDTAIEPEIKCCTMSNSKTRKTDWASLSACGSDNPWMQSGACLYSDTSAFVDANYVFGGYEFGALYQHSNTNSSINGRQFSEMPKEIIGDILTGSWEKDKLIEVPKTDKERSQNDPKQDEPISLGPLTSGSKKNSRHDEHEVGKGIEAPEVKADDGDFPPDVNLRKKTRRKSKRISEIKMHTLYESNVLGSDNAHNTGWPDIDSNGFQLESKQIQECLVFDQASKESHRNLSSPMPLLHEVEKKCLKVDKVQDSSNSSERARKKPTTCAIEDDDLLVSAIIGNKDSRTQSIANREPRKRGRPKKRKGGCRLLLQNLVKGKKHFTNGKWTGIGSRTVLSWLIMAEVIALNDIIQYRKPKAATVIKEGLVTRDGLMCKCCNLVLSLSEFKKHAGFRQNHPCLNLFTESGRPLTLCLLQAWSSEYKNRKSGFRKVESDEDDQNDDSCGICGNGGELVCCDNCPSTFHQACLIMQELPDGCWYCSNCTCWICGELVNVKDAPTSFHAFKCFQCEHKYHEVCLKGKNILKGMVPDTWFCSASCDEIYYGLSSHVGVINYMADGFSWTLLRCIHEDQKVHSAQRFALKAECNSKLAVSLSIMEESFQSMVDPRTGIDMIPQLVYNWGSNFARLNFHGFYTVVLEKDDVLISVASIRVHGMTVAEMPLIATCSSYRRQGMCRRLITAIEEMLISFKVEKLVVAAIPALVETWTKGFGFELVDSEEKKSLNKINFMVFPETLMLKKSLYKPPSGDNLPCEKDKSISITCLNGNPVDTSIPGFGGELGSYEVGKWMEDRPTEEKDLQEFEIGNQMEIADSDDEPPPGFPVPFKIK